MHILSRFLMVFGAGVGAAGLLGFFAFIPFMFLGADSLLIDAMLLWGCVTFSLGIGLFALGQGMIDSLNDQAYYLKRRTLSLNPQ